MLPQVETEEGTPTPIKLKPASDKIKLETFVVAETITGERTLGRICLNIIEVLLMPKASQTWTYVSVFRARNSFLTIR